MRSNKEMTNLKANEIDDSTELISQFFRAKNPLPHFKDLYKKNIEKIPVYYHRTLLQIAAKLGNLASVEWLLQQPGIDINYQDAIGQTALHLAVEGQHVGVAKLLLSANAQLLSDIQGQTPVHLLVLSQNKSIAPILCRKANLANFILKDINNHTAFSLLLESEPFDECLATQLIHTGGAVLDFSIWKELFAGYQKRAIVQKYIFLAACSFGYIDIFNEIVKKKSEFASNVDFLKYSPFLISAANGQIHFAKWLLVNGYAKPHEKSHDDMTAFLCTASAGRIEFVKWLLENNYAKSDEKDKYCMTVFLYAAANGQIEFAKWLLVNGYSRPDEKCPDGRTPFFWTASYGQIHFAKWLLENNYATPNETDRNGMTVFFRAVTAGRIEFAKWLLDKSYAKPDEVNQLYLKVGLSIDLARKALGLIIEHLLQHTHHNLLEDLIVKPIINFHKKFKQFLIDQLEEYVKKCAAIDDFDSCLIIAKIQAKYTLPSQLIPLLLKRTKDHIFVFKHKEKEVSLPSEVLLQSMLKKWDEFLNTYKQIDELAALLIDVEISNQYGRADRVYENYLAILNNPNYSADVKQQASVSLAELLMQGSISIDNGVFPDGLASEDLPRVTMEDTFSAIIEKKKKIQEILIARAVQAYEYVAEYKDLEMGKRVLAKLHIMLSGEDKINIENPVWKLQACFLFAKYYSSKMVKVGFEYDKQYKRVLEDFEAHTERNKQLLEENKLLKQQLDCQSTTQDLARKRSEENRSPSQIFRP